MGSVMMIMDMNHTHLLCLDDPDVYYDKTYEIPGEKDQIDCISAHTSELTCSYSPM